MHFHTYGNLSMDGNTHLWDIMLGMTLVSTTIVSLMPKKRAFPGGDRRQRTWHCLCC